MSSIISNNTAAGIGPFTAAKASSGVSSIISTIFIHTCLSMCYNIL